MGRKVPRGVILAFAVSATILAQTAMAQQGGRRAGGRGVARVGGGAIQPIVLATLTPVQEELKLDDDAKQKVAAFSRESNRERRNITQNAQGEARGVREKVAQLNADIAKKLTAVLSEEQQARLLQLYIQVNGASVLGDKAIAEALKMTEEQQAEFTAALAASRQRRGGGGQDLTPEERARRRAEANAARDKALLAVLSEDQRNQFETMKGQKLEIDITARLVRGRGGGRGQGRGQGGGRGNQQQSRDKLP